MGQVSVPWNFGSPFVHRHLALVLSAAGSGGAQSQGWRDIIHGNAIALVKASAPDALHGKYRSLQLGSALTELCEAELPPPLFLGGRDVTAAFALWTRLIESAFDALVKALTGRNLERIDWIA